MKKIFFYVMIFAFSAFILYVLYDILKLGYSNVRMYRVILAVFFTINLFYLIKKIVKNKIDGDAPM